MKDNLIAQLISSSAKSIVLIIGLIISISCIPFQHVSSAAELEDNSHFLGQSSSAAFNPDGTISDSSLFHSKNTELTLKSIEMKKDLSRSVKLDGLDRQLNELMSAHEHLTQKLGAIETAPQLNRHQLRFLQVEIENGFLKISRLLQLFTQEHGKVKLWQNYWNIQNQNLLDIQKQVETGTLPFGAHDSVEELRAVIEEARSVLRTAMEPVSEIQRKVENLQVAAHQTEYEIFKLFNDQSLTSTHNTPFYSIAFFEQFKKDRWSQATESIKLAFQPNLRELLPYKLQVIIAVLLFWLITTSVKRVRQIILQTSRWQFLAQRQYSVATLLSLTFFQIISREVSAFWLFIPGMINLFCLWRIGDVVLREDYRKNFLKCLIFILLLTNLFVLISLPSLLERLFLVSVSLILITVSVYHNRSGKLSQYRKQSLVWFSQLLVLIMGVIIIAEFSGRSEFAYFLFASSIRTIFSLLLAWIIYLCIVNLVEVNLYHVPSTNLSRYAGQIYNFVQPPILAAILFVLTVTLLVIWRVYPTAVVAVEKIEQFSVSLGSFTISLSLAFQAVIFLYLSFCVSKLAEVVLLEKFFPGRQLDRGVQLSIARLANYFIVLIGFIGTMMIMGISMTNITILGGAVGIGIGFGLQAIFNNFISGIILLFERTIKIGDVIMIEGDYAEVKELGLRATVVETLDNAEIVIPNSTLITSNVTNWTLGRRQVRIKVPIGVAYGSDVDKVIDIIIQCAQEHPRVLSQPKPLALFVAHGESSLDFELRAFVPDVGDRMSSISELNQAINAALDEAGIDIPFPQRDLHLKTTSYEFQQSVPNNNHPQNERPSP